MVRSFRDSATKPDQSDKRTTDSFRVALPLDVKIVIWERGLPLRRAGLDGRPLLLSMDFDVPGVKMRSKAALK
jgi:hypothetical protein